jgi:hypothetical protein
VKNIRWAKLLMRIFKIDVGTCPKCGSEMKIGGAVQDQASIKRYLTHLGLPIDPPPIAPARHQQRHLFDEDQRPPEYPENQ